METPHMPSPDPLPDTTPSALPSPLAPIVPLAAPPSPPSPSLPVSPLLVVAMGLPGAGKSTLCAAFAHLARRVSDHPRSLPFTSQSNSVVTLLRRSMRITTFPASNAASLCGLVTLMRLIPRALQPVCAQAGTHTTVVSFDSYARGTGRDGSVGEEGGVGDVAFMPRPDADTCAAFSHDARRDARAARDAHRLVVTAARAAAEAGRTALPLPHLPYAPSLPPSTPLLRALCFSDGAPHIVDLSGSMHCATILPHPCIPSSTHAYHHPRMHKSPCTHAYITMHAQASRVTALAALTAALARASQGGRESAAAALQGGGGDDAAVALANAPETTGATASVRAAAGWEVRVPAHMVVADDTMHLRSMRLQLLRLAHSCEMTRDQCISRNEHRLPTARLPPAVIRRTAARLEPPRGVPVVTVRGGGFAEGAEEGSANKRGAEEGSANKRGAEEGSANKRGAEEGSANKRGAEEGSASKRGAEGGRGREQEGGREGGNGTAAAAADSGVLCWSRRGEWEAGRCVAVDLGGVAVGDVSDVR
ncbi:unnamed protein product [Closterium sp. NIES-54]